MSADRPKIVRTVADLIEELQKFEGDLPVVVAHALTGGSDDFQWILTAALAPPAKDKVAIIYLERTN